jgi:nucleotide-binding universal stress UspA family protein
VKRKILVALDTSAGSDAALREAEALAMAEGAVLRLLHVAPPPRAWVEHERVVSYADQEAARVREDTLRYLADRDVRLPPERVELTVRFGDPADEILAEARECGADVIAMATRRRTGLQRLARTSVAREVLRAAPVPVLLVGWGPDTEGAEAAEARRVPVARRAFWCREQDREVVVEFEMGGLPGFRSPVEVRSCSAFDPPTDIACERRCLDPAFRDRWQPSRFAGLNTGG